MEEISQIFKKKKSLKNIYGFLYRLFFSGKSLELLSFIIWELKILFGLYPEDQWLSFSTKELLIPENQPLDSWKSESSGFEISRSNYNWSVVYFDSSMNIWGSTFENDSVLYSLDSKGKMTEIFRFGSKIEGLYISTEGNVFCCSKGILYKKLPDKNFKQVLQFSTEQSRFRKEAFTETPNGELLIGEYANVLENDRWKFVGYIYHSMNQGNSWQKLDFLKKVGINKHVHILKWSELLNGLIMTDGDNQKNLWINQSKSHFDRFSSNAKTGWKKINKNHIQKGGYTAITEINGEVMLGTDYNGGTNFLVFSRNMKDFKAKVIPNPYRRGFFDRLVIRKTKSGQYEVWCSLIFANSKNVKSLLMLSIDYGKTWQRIFEYDGTHFDLRFISMSNSVGEAIYFSLKQRDKSHATAMCIHS